MRFMGAFLAVICVGIAIPAAAAPLTAEMQHALLESRAVYVAVEATTWMPRGRTLADIGPTIRRRLAAEHFTVVRAADEPHDLTMTVRYAELRGPEYRVGEYGTVIRCAIGLVHRDAGVLWERTLESRSGDGSSGTPPYLEALEDFQTNPYYFFVGRITRAATEGPLDLVDVLAVGLRTLAVAAAEDATNGSGDGDLGHGMTFRESVYTTLILDKTIDELARSRDPRVPDVLSDLLRNPDARIRLAAVRALRPSAADAGVRVGLQHAADGDADQRVRRAAAALLAEGSRKAQADSPAR